MAFSAADGGAVCARPSRATAPGGRWRRRSRRAGPSPRCRATASPLGPVARRRPRLRPSPGLRGRCGTRGPPGRSRPPSSGRWGGTSRTRRSCSATRLLLKAYRRIQPGLNPDLELTAFLSEEAAFPGVPRLAGWAEVVTRDAGVVDRRDAPGVRRRRRRRVRGDRGAPRGARSARSEPADLEAGDRPRRGPRDPGRRAARRARRAARRTRRTSRPARPPTTSSGRGALDATRQLSAAIAALGAVDPGLAEELQPRRARDHRPRGRGSRPSPRCRSSCASTRTSTSARCWSPTTAIG